MKKVDMVGKKFGRWLVIEEAEQKYGTGAFYLCECSCGARKVVKGYHLRKGLSSSCGCYSREVASEMRKNKKTHGLSNSRIYHIWVGMYGRCNDSKRPEYPRYGGRGIVICEDWKERANFFNWALTNGYDDNLTLDRIDPNGNYEPTNCRWITSKEQANNRRNTRYVEYEGNTYTLSDFSNTFLSINKDTFYSRLSNGKTMEECMDENKKINQYK